MYKISVPIDKIEYHFGITIERNMSSLGLDTATNTGYCVAKANTKNITFDIGYFKIDVGKIKDKYKREELRYRMVYDNLKPVIKAPDIVVIENTYYSNSAKATIILSRIGGVAYAIARAKNIPSIIWRTASEARKTLGIKGNSKKEEILSIVNLLLDIDIKNHDEADAVVLALNGLIKRR
jgi:Holliday junction resolvasome RuvABC endonuclease subunit